MNNALHTLAAEAGIEISWRNVTGNVQTVSEDSLRAVLGALGLPAGSDAQIRESQAILREESITGSRPLITAELNHSITLPGNPGHFRITLESGRVVEGIAEPAENGIRLPAIQEPGYHRVEINGIFTTLAVAPPRAYTLEDAGGGAKLWGLALQLYALRRENDGGIGDFKALADFVRNAAAHGADAVAISPTHAQFSADVSHYAPYAPSNRSAHNVLYAPLDVPGLHDGELIDWPEAASRRLQIQRANFQNFHDHAELERFRRQAGAGLEFHAVFEALAAMLSVNNPSGRDFRTWPQEYRDPRNAAVTRFMTDHANEISFHAWLQFMADHGLANAQKTARDAGMKIGLITDLAVGTDLTGSHSWTRQHEILHGLEIGAPPDLLNYEGQCWGITAFSPRGLRYSGFSAFIDMLRHALRHAGGLRIDHVMGLARLWVIPLGAPSGHGVYLRLPVEDLIRLVTLESQRHRAVILGEDLGTLPHGFADTLNAAGIAGLRVMWFEHDGSHFKPPHEWTRSAVAMTTTHDLPSVAGWWQGEDISWREKLKMGGDAMEKRETDRAGLWSAFQNSGATSADMPSAQNGAAAADAACGHLGRAASMLALLPIEDALGLPEQPNIPGTTNEHPNWCRRLPAHSDNLFARPDVAARLAALNAARKA